MRCPKCSCERSSVIDSRGDGLTIRRRRECQECQFRFTTYERLEVSLPAVVKKDGRREPWVTEKLRAGVLRACEKRPVSIKAIDEAIANVERQAQELCVKEIPSIKIGDFVMDELRELDQIAYVRFASVYREFSDVREFVATLESLGPEHEGVPGKEPVS